jgi:hypothetical protein
LFAAFGVIKLEVVEQLAEQFSEAETDPDEQREEGEHRERRTLATATAKSAATLPARPRTNASE